MAVHSIGRNITMHRILAIAVLLVAGAFPPSAGAFFQVDAFTVLGCTFNGNVGAFTACLTSASADAVKDAEATLRNSPAMAQLDSELALLQVVRHDDIVEMASCLQQAGVDLGGAIGSMAANPRGTAANRLHVMVGQRLATLTAGMGQVALAGRQFDPSSPASAGSALDQAFDQLVAAAATDPVASCGIPVLQAQQAQIKQVAAQAYGVLQTQVNTLMTDAVTPALHSISRAVLAESLQAIDARGANAPPIQRQPPRATTPSRTAPPPERQPPPLRQPATRADADRSKTSTTISQARATRSEPAVRTRAGATFLNPDPALQAAGQAIDGGRRWLSSRFPDDLQKIAHAELAAYLLRNPHLTASAATVDALGDAQAAGAPGSVSLAPLDALLDDLRESNHEMYTHIALSTIHFYGHETIDVVVDPIVGFVVGHVSGQISLVDNAIAVACTTGHFVSQLPCGGVKALVVFLAKQLMIPAIEWAAVEAIRASWDGATECAAVAVGVAEPDARQNCAIYQPLLQWFPATAAAATAFVLPHIEDSRRAFVDYHTAVLKLAQSAGTPAGRR